MKRFFIGALLITPYIFAASNDGGASTPLPETGHAYWGNKSYAALARLARAKTMHTNLAKAHAHAVKNEMHNQVWKLAKARDSWATEKQKALGLFLEAQANYNATTSCTRIKISAKL